MPPTVYSSLLPGATTCVLVIGVGHYPALPGGGGSPMARPEGMQQLRSPPVSTREFSRWVTEPTPAAKGLAETAGDMLYEKNINPLAAASGGYALVSSAVDTKSQRWHHWIENLMRQFEQLPDGTIHYGTMRMRLRTSEDDLSVGQGRFSCFLCAALGRHYRHLAGQGPL